MVVDTGEEYGTWPGEQCAVVYCIIIQVLCGFSLLLFILLTIELKL